MATPGFRLQSAPSTNGTVRIVRRLGYDEAERMVKRKRARRLLDGAGEVIGYQLVASKALAGSITVTSAVIAGRPLTTDSDPSCAVLSAAEREAVVGLSGGLDAQDAARVKLSHFRPVRRRRNREGQR